MTKKVFFKALMSLFVALAIVSCSNHDENNEDSIIVQNQDDLTQRVYADNTSGKSVKFTIKGAWSSRISEENVTTRDISPETPEWISIDPTEGNAAGEYTIKISLTTNYTGKNRYAKILIMRHDTAIVIDITQSGKKEDGTVPS